MSGPVTAAPVPQAPARKPSAPQPDRAARASAGEAARERAAAPAWHFGSLPLQAKLAMSRPGDAFEVEADRTAERVMRMPDPAASAEGAPRPAAAPLAISRYAGGTVRRAEVGRDDEQNGQTLTFSASDLLSMKTWYSGNA